MKPSKGKEDYQEIRREQLSRWMNFINERFEPISHFFMILIFFAAHYMMAKAMGEVTLRPVQVLWLSLGTGCFFLKLRFYDEIKDYEVDLEKNPTRPLPRGLLNHFDLKKGIENCIILEIIFFATCGLNSLIAILFSIGYSLLMYKEFFIASSIRPHLTTYATSHTVVTLFLSLSIFSALNNHYPWSQNLDFFLFSFMSWFLFNIFELGRKTYQPDEEQKEVPTYSNVWGKWGAFSLVLIHAIAVTILSLQLSTIEYSFMLYAQTGCLSLLFLVGTLYLLTRTPKTGILYRNFSSIYIVLIYAGFLINYTLIQ